MLATVPRDTFLALIGTKSTTLAQRMHTGEAAFALGCERPAHIGEYLHLDCVAMILASMLNCFSGLELKRAANIVRDHWDSWLRLLVKTEHSSALGEQFCCVAWTSLDRRLPPRIAFGDGAEVAAALSSECVAPTFIAMSFVLRCLRENARQGGIDLPERLTVDPNDKPAYEKWRSEIDLYREHAGARRARARTPA